MKIRNGFVSNSSSSSFVFLGVRRELTDEDDLEELWNRDDCLCCNDYYLQGELLAQGYDDGEPLEEEPFTIEELSEMSVAIARELKVDPRNVKLHIGTRSC